MTFLAGTTDGPIIIQSPNTLIFGTGNASSDVYLKEVAGGLSISQPVSVPSTGIINPGGSPVLVAKSDMLAQAANIGATTLYTTPTNGAGMYRISAYNVVTQAATVSSTLPSIFFTWTDNDSGAVGAGISVTNTSAANTVGATGVNGAGQFPGVATINVKAGTMINFVTSNYASSGATPMQYAIHIKLEYLGA